MLRSVSGPFGFYLDRLSFAAFTDMGGAWCPASLAETGTPICTARGGRDAWVASAGAELIFDLALQYDVPYRLRVGAGAPWRTPAGTGRSAAFYITLGGTF